MIRWRCAILYDSSAKYPQHASAVYAACLVRASSTVSAPIRNPFLFHHRPNALDRDPIVVPAGWDSLGKIGVLREGFEARVWGEAWDTDLTDASETVDAGGAKIVSRALVPDQGAKVTSSIGLSLHFHHFRPKSPPLPPSNAPMAEQAFLVKHYDENSKKLDRDPCGTFHNPTETTAAGIVGPWEQ